MKNTMNYVKSCFTFVKQYFKWLPIPKWAKVLIIVLFFTFKWFIPDLILVPALYKLFKFHAEKCGAEFLKEGTSH